jgi:hypothetical protein
MFARAPLYPANPKTRLARNQLARHDETKALKTGKSSMMALARGGLLAVVYLVWPAGR